MRNAVRSDRIPMRVVDTECLAFDPSEFLGNALPIAMTDAFKRLRDVTFLGILSRSFGEIDGHPLGDNGARDQTRAHHSLKVALLISRMTFELGLSAQARKYAVAWGMLHDIATWPLSHTGEAAFAEATDTDARDLRRAMIVGDASVGPFSVADALRDLSIDADLLLALFEKAAPTSADDLCVVHQLVHSPLTPDTLEGIHRSGRVFGVPVPHPNTFICSMQRDLFSGVMLREDHSKSAFSFWRSKAKIYADFINHDRTVEFESAWSKSIRDDFAGTALIDSLSLKEKEIIDRSVDRGVKRSSEVVRYKAPLKYGVAESYKKKRVLKGSMSMEDLSGVFVKVRS